MSAAMMSYIRAKLAWLERGSKGPEPNFTDYELSATAKEAAPITMRAAPRGETCRPPERAGKVSAMCTLKAG